ncbi:MAG: hypothetical protein C0403_12740 [Desulfobacterium sp.]|nr:hypothetical protein [Desulfobacterium sp.]
MLQKPFNIEAWIGADDLYLKLLDDATSDADLRSPPSNHFEKLSGKRKDKCSIRVNNQY